MVQYNYCLNVSHRMLPRCMSSSDFYVWGPRLKHFSVLGFWDHGILTFFFFSDHIRWFYSRFYVPSGSVNLGKWFYLPNHANIHTVLEYEFKTELDVINSSIITNFYLYIFFPENSSQWKIGENVTKSRVMIELFLNVLHRTDMN